MNDEKKKKNRDVREIKKNAKKVQRENEDKEEVEGEQERTRQKREGGGEKERERKTKNSMAITSEEEKKNTPQNSRTQGTSEWLLVRIREWKRTEKLYWLKK